eukprot:403765-Amphidinium_carterae.1
MSCLQRPTALETQRSRVQTLRDKARAKTLSAKAIGGGELVAAAATPSRPGRARAAKPVVEHCRLLSSHGAQTMTQGALSYIASGWI